MNQTMKRGLGLFLSLTITSLAAFAGGSAHYSKATATAVPTGKGTVYVKGPGTDAPGEGDYSAFAEYSEDSYNNSASSSVPNNSYTLYAHPASPLIEFKGWYDDVACEGNPLSTDEAYTVTFAASSITQGSPTTKNYFALFADKDLGDLPEGALNTSLTVVLADGAQGTVGVATDIWEAMDATATSASHEGSVDDLYHKYYCVGSSADPAANVVMWYTDAELTHLAGISAVDDVFTYEVEASTEGPVDVTLYAAFGTTNTYTLPVEIAVTGTGMLGSAITASDGVKDPTQVSLATADGGQTYTLNISYVNLGEVVINNIILADLKPVDMGDGIAYLPETSIHATVADVEVYNSTINNLAGSTINDIKKNGIDIPLALVVDTKNNTMYAKAKITISLGIAGIQSYIYIGNELGAVDGETFTRYEAIEGLDTEGDFLLYNLASGKWMQPNNTNASNAYYRADRDDPYAILGDQGFLMHFVKKAGGYNIASEFKNYLDTNRDDYYYDRTPGPAWSVVKVGEMNGMPVVRLRTMFGDLGQNEDKHLDYFLCPTDELKTTSKNGYNHFLDWVLVSKAERIAMIAAEENAAPEATFLIKGYDFDKNNDGVEAWEMTGPHENWNRNGGPGRNSVFETWAKTNVELYQTVDGLPDGVYTLTAEAAYSPTGNDGISETTYNQYGETSHAIVYAGDQKAAVKSVYANIKAEAGNGYNTELAAGQWVCRNVDDFSDAFRLTDDFLVEIPNVEVQGGQLRIGAKIENGTGRSWIMLDKVRLVRTGDLPEPELQLLYTVNGVVGDPYGMMGKVAFNNTPVAVEVYDNSTLVIKNWDGTEGSDLRIAYTEDEVWGAEITSITQIVDGEELEAEETDEAYVLYPQSAEYPLFAADKENISLGVFNDDQAGYLMLAGMFYPAAQADPELGGMQFGDPVMMAYSVYWPGEPVVEPQEPEMVYSAPAIFQSADEDELPNELVAWPETHTTVEVWSDNSLMLRGWAGAAGYDLKVKLEGNGNVSENELGEKVYYGSGSVESIRLFDAEGEEIILSLTTSEIDAGEDYTLCYVAVPTGREDSEVAYFVFADFGDGMTLADAYGVINGESGNLFMMMIVPEDDDVMVYSIEWSPAITTGINTPVAKITKVGTYNIAGQKVSDAFKGIVIRDGKKMLNK